MMKRKKIPSLKLRVRTWKIDPLEFRRFRAWKTHGYFRGELFVLGVLVSGKKGKDRESDLDLQFETLCDVYENDVFLGQNFRPWTEEMDLNPMDPKEKALRIFRDMQKKHKQCNTILYTTLKLVSLKMLENAWKNYHLESQVSYFFRQLYP